MSLAAFIRDNRDDIIDLWCEKVAGRLGLAADMKPQLINDMPELLDDIVEALEQPPDQWSSTRARAHASQRVAIGMDIGGLSEEVGMVGETILELAADRSAVLEARELSYMLRALARGAAESVTEYARLRDQELQRQSAEHFSFVAHELRTPLQSARFAVELLAETNPSPIIDRLKRAQEQVATLVDNALVKARLTAEPNVRKESASSLQLAESAAENGRPLAEQQEIALRVQGDDFDIVVDPRLITSALTNLVINGIKFSRVGGSVAVRVAEKEERVHFEVSDSCGGIPDEALPTLFQLFGQAGEDRSGFGLGLLIVKQVAELHGGSVRVVNKSGEGCCFILDLPRNPSREIADRM